jgi:integrase
MPRVSKNYVPKYRLHKQSGQAIVTLSYVDHLLGKYGTPESRAAYHTLIAQWEANARKPLKQFPVAGAEQPAAPLSLDAMLDAYLRAMEAERPQEDGGTTGNVRDSRRAFKPLRDAFGTVPAASFDSLLLQEFRKRLIDRGRVRKSINLDINRIRTAFRWGTEQKLIPATVWYELRAVKAVRPGQFGVAEGRKVQPVDTSIVDAILSHLSPTVAAIVRLQALTGARPSEILKMTPGEIDRADNGWVYTPSKHKTAYRGKTRVIPLGPRARAVLQPLLDGLADTDYVFSPKRGNAQSKAMHAKRGRRADQKPNPKQTDRTIGNCYTVGSYRQAIHKACDKANAAAIRAAVAQGKAVDPGKRIIERFGPHRLRHSFATLIANHPDHKLDNARDLLGHSSVTTTERYVRPDLAKAKEIAEELG